MSNPFSLNSKDVFQMRRKEREMMQKEHESSKRLSVWEKTALSRSTRSHKRNVHRTKLSNKHLGENTFTSHRKEKENMNDFIGKKREMFLIQMSVDSKREEIQKLEEDANKREEALRRSEMLLEEDAMRFDAFLKENDRKAHDALKIADQESREKQEKNTQIKKLQAEIQKVSKEINNYDAELTQCLMYKQFLTDLTPPEYLSSQNNNNQNNNQQQPVMYFKKPEQLLNLFAHLEERNLFLIQNAQEMEEALEELKQKYADKRADMDEKTQKLQEEIQSLQSKITAEMSKSQALARRRQANSASGVQQELLNELSTHIKIVYEQCGFDPDNQSDSIDQLREIEGWLEYLLNEIYSMDPVKVAHEEKEKQAQRRNVKRNERKEETRKAYEERLAKSTARAKAEVIKNTGRPVMFRSPPIKRKVKKETKHERDEEAEELMRYLT